MDKAKFVKKMESLIKETREYANLERLDYVTSGNMEFLYATFENKEQMRVNITGNSEMAILKDFVNGKGQYIHRDSPNYLSFDNLKEDNLQSAMYDYLNGCSLTKDALFDDQLLLRIAEKADVSAIDLKEYIFFFFSESAEDSIKQKMSAWLMAHTYCEVVFDTDDAVCIICRHAPTEKELLDFCKESMEKFGATEIKNYDPLSFKSAHSLYDMTMESTFPILKAGQQEQERGL